MAPFYHRLNMNSMQALWDYLINIKGIPKIGEVVYRTQWTLTSGTESKVNLISKTRLQEFYIDCSCEEIII